MEKWGTNCVVLSCLTGLTYNKHFGSILASITGTNPHSWCHSGTSMLQCPAWPSPTAWKDKWCGGSYVILTIALCPEVAVLWADSTRWACLLPAGLFFCQHTNIHKDMPREVVQSASLEIFKNCLVMLLGRQLSDSPRAVFFQTALGFDQMTPPRSHLTSGILWYTMILCSPDLLPLQACPSVNSAFPCPCGGHRAGPGMVARPSHQPRPQGSSQWWGGCKVQIGSPSTGQGQDQVQWWLGREKIAVRSSDKAAPAGQALYLQAHIWGEILQSPVLDQTCGFQCIFIDWLI